MKTILFLGAASFQIPPILHAKKKGFRVITCDNNINNPGHKYADRSYEVSTLDVGKVLEIAQKECVEAVLSYASDVSALTVAYVQSKLTLPGNSERSIMTLTNKNLFREFLFKNGFQRSEFRRFKKKDKNLVYDYVKKFDEGFVIKPTDSSGTKGVTVIYNDADIQPALDYAFGFSSRGEIIIEEYIKRIGKQVCGDGFFLNGELVFIEFGDGHTYDYPLPPVPWGETFPSSHETSVLIQVTKKLTEVLKAAGFKVGPFNFDVIITADGKPFIIEIGPRAGGNFIQDIIRLNTGVDLIEHSINCALGNPVNINKIKSTDNNFYASYMLHSLKAGVLRSIDFAPEITPFIYKKNIYIETGDKVEKFDHGMHAFGNIIFKFKTLGEMQGTYEFINEKISIGIQ